MGRDQDTVVTVEVPEHQPVLTRRAAQVLLALLREAATESRDHEEPEGSK